MSLYNSFTKLIISFDTGPVPPPFCYRYTIDISKNESELKVSLNLEYYDRDEITEQEIYDEGYSLDDDYKWEGTLPEVWVNALENRLSRTNWTKKILPDDGASLSVKISESGKSELLYPAEKRTWEILAQDIIQAIFELGKKEAPLHIEYLSVGDKNQKVGLSLKYSFSERKVELQTTSNRELALDWAEGQKLMQHIYFFDFMPDEAMDKIPNIQGEYVSPGDGLWYALNDNSEEHLAIRKKKLIETLKSYF